MNALYDPTHICIYYYSAGWSSTIAELAASICHERPCSAFQSNNFGAQIYIGLLIYYYFAFPLFTLQLQINFVLCGHLILETKLEMGDRYR